MGEYITIDGIENKIGTCENIYGFTLPELRKLLAEGRALANEIGPYLDPKNGFRYRFPFPDEDKMKTRERWNLYERVVQVPAPSGFYAQTKAQDHYRVYVEKNVSDICGHAAARLPCPNTEEGKRLWLNRENALQTVGICQQKQVDGQLWTTVKCPYCDAMWRLAPDEAKDMVEKTTSWFKNETQSTREFYEKLCRRVMAGYMPRVLRKTLPPRYGRLHRTRNACAK